MDLALFDKLVAIINQNGANLEAYQELCNDQAILVKKQREMIEVMDRQIMVLTEIVETAREGWYTTNRLARIASDAVVDGYTQQTADQANALTRRSEILLNEYKQLCILYDKERARYAEQNRVTKSSDDDDSGMQSSES